MEKGQSYIGHSSSAISRSNRNNTGYTSDIVLDKVIFHNVFDKDIRRVFIYKKAEHLANALCLVAPAFRESVSLKERLDGIAIALTTAATEAPTTFRETLSHQLLALSSVLALARVAGLLSVMNIDLIASEVNLLLQEMALYEEPRLTLLESPTLAMIARRASDIPTFHSSASPRARRELIVPSAGVKATQKPQGQSSKRHDGILSVIRSKGRATIRDISTVIRGVSEKTIQRELQSLIEARQVVKHGERRWTTYSLA